MGYSNFGKVKTNVLPLPSSYMSYEEYKDLYGIDLERDELGDLILIRDGEDTYPVLYNDRENKILYTAEKAFDYSNGFEIISNTSLVSKVISTGTIENAKPIYWHTIYIVRGGGVGYTSTFCGYMIILNNSPDLLNINDFVSLLATPGFVGIFINGRFGQTSGDLTNLSQVAFRLVNVDSSRITIYYSTSLTDMTEDSITIGNIADSYTTFIDLGSNKVN